MLEGAGGFSRTHNRLSEARLATRRRGSRRGVESIGFRQTAHEPHTPQSYAHTRVPPHVGERGYVGRQDRDA